MAHEEPGEAARTALILTYIYYMVHGMADGWLYGGLHVIVNKKSVCEHMTFIEDSFDGQLCFDWIDYSGYSIS